MRFHRSNCLKSFAIAGAVAVCCTTFSSYSWGQQIPPNPQPARSAPAESQPQRQTQLPPGPGIATAITAQSPLELRRLIGQFRERLRLAGIKSVVVVGEEWPAGRQNALQNWLIGQVKDVLGGDPNHFDVLPDEPGAPLKGFAGPVLSTVGVDAVVSTTLYPAEDGIHFTLEAARANVSRGQETLIADISDALPLTDESAALVPPEWKIQVDEERAAPKPPMADGSILSKMPACLVCPDPKYSELARQLKVNGGVTLMATVETDGTIHGAQIVKAFGFGFDEAAIKNMSRWQLSPALDKQGNPIAVRITVQIEFRLL